MTDIRNVNNILKIGIPIFLKFPTRSEQKFSSVLNIFLNYDILRKRIIIKFRHLNKQ